MKQADILIIGGDRRQTCCAHILSEHGHHVNTFLVPDIPQTADMSTKAGFESAVELLKKYMSTAAYILCPTPFSKDSVNINTSAEYSDVRLPVKLLISLASGHQTLIGGAISDKVYELLTKNDIPCHDLMKFDSLAYANAQLTAEGLLKYIIEAVPFSIASSSVLVLGYGRCGSAAAGLLRSLGASVTIYTRNHSLSCKAKALGLPVMTALPASQALSTFNIIINTVPYIIYTKEQLLYTRKDAFLFEVASSPGGFDLDYVRANNIHYKNCPAIPGRLSPLSAADIICHVLENEL